MHSFTETCLPIAYQNALYPERKEEYAASHHCPACSRLSRYTLGMIMWTMKNRGVEFEIPLWLEIGTESVVTKKVGDVNRLFMGVVDDDILDGMEKFAHS